ncbi:MAG: Glu-tRNA(Gln) amidotransferase GatDE subunit D [Candidatus Aenigmarchaeota archaeon ex4484_14]|nr:MAG: Glu-tRNA(Gln) amidotransferase GatDE subunit D [Candidatus Aenigmarchaeota archaeon ex4484_14]
MTGYSQALKTLIKESGAGVGDRVAVSVEGESYEGLLMPRPDIGDESCLIIKLDNGYNIGLKYKKGMEMKKLSAGEGGLGKAKNISKLVFDPKKPPVSLVATGGTISSRVDYKTGGVYMLMSPEEILQSAPELANVVNLRSIESPFRKASEDMEPKDWAVIAKHAAKCLNNGDNGVIVTHGTDTLHYTSAALSFMLKNLHKPVVLVGAQRSSDRGSADTTMNLICSAHAAISDIAEVGICMHGSMNDDYCLFIRGTKVRKMHTSRRDAFRPINEYPLAKVWPDGRMEKMNKNCKKRNDKEKATADTKFEEKTALLKVYPGSDPNVLDYFASKKYRGIVIEGTGLGHVPTQNVKTWIPQIKKLVKDGVAIAVTSQTIYGRVNANVYTNLRILYHEAGAIPCEDMQPEIAYVKLGWVLGHTKDLDEVRKLMLTNMAGEITTSIDARAFLY